MNCIYCDNFIENKKALFENKLAIAYFDEFPVSKGHILIVTKRHAPTFFDITEEEQIAILELLNKCKKYLDEKNFVDWSCNVDRFNSNFCRRLSN